MPKIARVVIDSPVKELVDFYEYIIDGEMIKTLSVGMRVEVPFGKYNTRRMGYVIKIYDGEPETKLKTLLRQLDESPVINRERLVEAFWVKNRFFSTFSEAIRLFLPFGANIIFEEEITLCVSHEKLFEWAKGSDVRERLANAFEESGETIKYSALREVFGARARSLVNELYDSKMINIYHTDKKGIGSKKIKTVCLADGADIENIPGRAAAQKRAAEILGECGVLSIDDLCLFAGCSRASVAALVKNGIAMYRETEAFRRPTVKRVVGSQKKITLNPEQEKAVNDIWESMNGEFKPTLMHGITGSGKTEVYMELIDRVLQKNGSAIVLFPEISLTQQMIDRFLSRFGDKLAIIHSALSAGERYDEWRRIEMGQARVVIGARSAVFAPCQNLSLIVIDEEHEGTYKSESGVRYNAHDVAKYRAAAAKAGLVLGSATPSVSSYYKAKTGEYNLVELTMRSNSATLPDVTIADMRREIEEGNKSPFSRVLQSELTENIKKGEQSILFLNRRGYSTFVSCRSCGYVAKCPNCSISLTYHLRGDNLVCHYCGYKKPKPAKCPECESNYIHGFGTGTQKIEEKIGEEFSGASVIRMDNDTTRKKESHEKILNRFRESNIDILLGTQMIAKGLDFENVTLVGVLAADQILNMGDFRAGERTFDLITQVCGRAGRGNKKGRAVIQTYMPENPVIVNAAKQDYKAFYEEEIILRKTLNYPPFCDIINIMVTGSYEKSVKETADRLKRICDKALGAYGVKVYNAAPCHIDKVKNSYRWHFWLKCQYTPTIAAAVQKIIKTEKKLSVIADLNPNII